MSNRSLATSSMLGNSLLHRFCRLLRRGQAIVEFTMVLTLALIVLFVSVQLALLGECALALGQANYQGARYAAVNPKATLSDVANHLVKVGSPSITKNCGSNLTVAMTWTHYNTDGTTTTTPYTGQAGSCGSDTSFSQNPARSFGDKIEVDLTYNAADNLFLPNTGGGFFGITFPTTLTHKETAIVE